MNFELVVLVGLSLESLKFYFLWKSTKLRRSWIGIIDNRNFAVSIHDDEVSVLVGSRLNVFVAGEVIAADKIDSLYNLLAGWTKYLVLYPRAALRMKVMEMYALILDRGVKPDRDRDEAE